MELAEAANKLSSAGFHIEPWCEAAGFSRATFYSLPHGRQPRSIKIGARRIIIERPDDYLGRIEREQQPKAA